MKMARKISQI